MVAESMDLNTQIKYLEAFLKKPENSVCADCYSKSPRWASITFGVFVCIRCSGEHRRLGVHITKIKSVNLDKWPNGKVALFAESSNMLMNAYWEANMPQNFQKPLMNASGQQVNQFLTDKYVNKRWVNSKMKHEPVWLYENRKSKYDRFVKKTMKAIKGDISADEDDSDQEEKPVVKEKKKVSAPKKVVTQQVKQAPQQPPAASTTQMDNLISFENKQPSVLDNFSEFQTPSTNNSSNVATNDGFTNFQGGNTAPVQQQQQQQNTQSNDLLSNLSNMYAQSGVNTGNNKYAAFDAMNINGNTNQQNSFMPMAQNQQPMQAQQQQQNQPFQPMAMQQLQQQQQQQQQFNMNPQMFQQMQMQPQYQNQQQQQQQQPMFNNNLPTNMQQTTFTQQSQSYPQASNPQQQQQQTAQVYFKGAMKSDRQAQSLDSGFDDFQTGNNPQQNNNPNLYGGLVNLNQIQNTPSQQQQNMMANNGAAAQQNFDSLLKW